MFKKANLKDVITYKVKWLISMIKIACRIRGGK